MNRHDDSVVAIPLQLYYEEKPRALLTDELNCISEPHGQIRSAVIGYGYSHVHKTVQMGKLRGRYVQ